MSWNRVAAKRRGWSIDSSSAGRKMSGDPVVVVGWNFGIEKMSSTLVMRASA
jgi:hypothetical protein